MKTYYYFNAQDCDIEEYLETELYIANGKAVRADLTPFEPFTEIATLNEGLYETKDAAIHEGRAFCQGVIDGNNNARKFLEDVKEVK